MLWAPTCVPGLGYHARRDWPVKKATVNPPLSPPAYLFQAHLKRGAGGGLIETGGLFNLERAKVSVLHKEVEYGVEKLKYKKFQVMKPRISITSEFSVGK